MQMTGEARWTPEINMLEMLCNCGNVFEHRADRWRVACPKCGIRSNLKYLRQFLAQKRESSP